LLEEENEQDQVALDAAGDEEVGFDVLVAVLAQALHHRRVGEKVTDLKRAAFNRVNQHSGLFMNDLAGNAPDR